MGAKSRTPIPLRLLRDPGHLLAVGLGSGLLPKAPGTWGSLAALPLYYLMAGLSVPAYWGLTLALGLIGIWFCQRTADALHTHDHPGIVWDEWVGLLIALWPATGEPLAVAVGFVLFRLFDAIKPWPISVLDRRVHGGLGIMLDDVAAGAAAAVVLVGLLPWL